MVEEVRVGGAGGGGERELLLLALSERTVAERTRDSQMGSRHFRPSNSIAISSSIFNYNQVLS